MPAPGQLLVARAGDEGGEAAVLAGRRSGIVGAAEDEGRHPHRGEARHEIEVEDRGAAAELAGGRGAGDGVADLPPAAGVLRLEIIGEPALDRGVGQRRQRIGAAHGIEALCPDLVGPLGLAGSVSHHIAEMSRSP